MNGLAVILTAVLWASVEDYHGLWEYPGECEGASVGEESAEHVARAVLTALIADNLVSLYWCMEPDGGLNPIPASTALNLLQEPRWWEVPRKGERSVRVGATGADEEAYLRLTTPYPGPVLKPLA